MDVIVSHANADFDSLGGLVGATRLYPGAVPVLTGGAAANVRDFLALHADFLDLRGATDVRPEAIRRLIVVDACQKRRLGPAAAWVDLPSVEVHVFDHHTRVECDLGATQEWCEPWGAASSVITLRLRDTGITVTPFEATALLLGIYEDTGSLLFSATCPEDLEAAAWLVRAGGDLETVARFAHATLSPDERRVLASLTQCAEVCRIGGVPIVLAVAPPDEMMADAAPLLERLLESEGAAAGFLIAPMENALFVIGRSQSDAVPVDRVLQYLGGGGHARAASARVRSQSPEALLTRLRALLAEQVTPERTARDLMSYPVRSLPPEARIAEARSQMMRFGHSGLIILDQGKLVGIFTRRDADRAEQHGLAHQPVRNFMSRNVETTTPDAPLSRLQEQMVARRIGRLPVVEGGAVVGIVTRSDVLEALHGARFLQRVQPSTTPVLRAFREWLPAPIQERLEQLGQLAADDDQQLYVVGGFVRDLLLGAPSLDVDLVVEPDATRFARRVARELGGTVKTDPQFGTAHLVLPDGFALDFATARSESYQRPAALPEVESSSVADDLRRRDFSINAMAVSLRPETFGVLLDPAGGFDDLTQHLVRVLHPLSFVEDPTRVFRAVRLAERYRFALDPGTEQLASAAVSEGRLQELTPERYRAELFRTVREARPVGPLLRLHALGALNVLELQLNPDPELLQGVPGALEWWEKRTGSALDPPETAWVAALLSRSTPERAGQVAQERLRLAPAIAEQIVVTLRVLHEVAADGVFPLLSGPPSVVTARAKGLPPVALVLARAATTAAGAAGKEARGVLDRYVQDWRTRSLAFTGDDLIRLGYRPGRALGQALRETLAAHLDGHVRGREAELAYARHLLDTGQGSAPLDGDELTRGNRDGDSE